MNGNVTGQTCGNCGLTLDGDYLCFCNPQVINRMDIIGRLYQEDRAEEREAKKFITLITYWTFLIMFAVPVLPDTFMRDDCQKNYILLAVLGFYSIAWFLFGPKSLLTIHEYKKYREKYFKKNSKLLRDHKVFNPFGERELKERHCLNIIGEVIMGTKEGKSQKSRSWPHFAFYAPMLLLVIVAYFIAIKI